MLSKENWTYCQFKSGQFTVSISLGGVPGNNEAIEITYFLNKFDQKHIIHQEEFSSLDEAVLKANCTYSAWEFIDLEKKLQDGGCSTCQAHD